jgi:hypothetical protein
MKNEDIKDCCANCMLMELNKTLTILSDLQREIMIRNNGIGSQMLFDSMWDITQVIKEIAEDLTNQEKKD